MASSYYLPESDSSITYKFLDLGYFFPDSVSCFTSQVFDYGFEYTYNTALGFVQWQNGFFPHFEILMGSVIGGVVRGDTMLRVGLEEEIERLEVVISPNPTTNHLTIHSDVFITHVKFVDHLGRMVLVSGVEGKNFQFDLTALSMGVYFIQLKTSEGIITRRIVKT
jgi:hypothetical protein